MGFFCCCDGGGGGVAECFACGECYEVPEGGEGGPLQWLAHIGSVAGTCMLGDSCAPASGDHYLDYIGGCTWRSPGFDLCTTIPPSTGCFAWELIIGNYPDCDPNPVGVSQIRLRLANVCTGVAIVEYENNDGDTLTCNDEMTLARKVQLMCSAPLSVTVEPVWPP